MLVIPYGVPEHNDLVLSSGRQPLSSENKGCAFERVFRRPVHGRGTRSHAVRAVLDCYYAYPA
jgi:hypothetical protein